MALPDRAPVTHPSPQVAASAHPSSPDERAQDRALLCALGASASLEMGVRERDGIGVWGAWLPAGTRVHITALPGQRAADAADTAQRLRDAGLEPIPHIAARQLKNEAELQAMLQGFQDAAQVREVFIVAGDLREPRGAFASTADVLRTEALARYGISAVAVAAHPEGHPHVSDAILRASELEKVRLASLLGLQLRFITQFAFATRPLLDWARQLRARGVHAPVHFGLAGPTRLADLIRFAVRLGVGPSLARLTQRTGTATRLLGDRGPEPLVLELARSCAQQQGDFQGIHLFSFGGVTQSSRWLQALREGQFEFDAEESFVMQERR